MDAKKLHDEIATKAGLSVVSHPDHSATILRALAFLASAESSGDTVVVELRALEEDSVAAGYAEAVSRKAIAHILALKAELAEREQTERDLRRIIERGKPVSEREKDLSAVCDGYIKAAENILARAEKAEAELASVKANAESIGDEVVRELHALRESAKPFPSGAGGQQCGMESYRIVASGNQLEVIYTAAARIAALQAELASVKAERDALDQKLWELKHPSAAIPRAAHPKDAP